MTAICPGSGPSSYKAQYGPVAYVAPAVLGAMMNNARTRWAVPFAAALGFLTYDLANFCITDPPADPGLTAADLILFIAPPATPGRDAAVAKVAQFVSHYLWYEFCECTPGPQPALPAPAAEPVGAPSIVTTIPAGPLVPQGFYFMDHTNTKAFDLGCGSPVPPANFFLPTFDDSAWPAAVGYTVAGPTWGGGYFQGANVGVNSALNAYGADGCAPSNPFSSLCTQFLLRWTFDLGDVTPTAATVRGAFPGVVQTPYWTTGGFWINGHGGVMFNALNWQAILPFLLPNQKNVIAFWVDSGNTGSANVWTGSPVGVQLMLDFSAAAQPTSVPCCAPDPNLNAMLSQILQLLTLTQRQAAPFGYVYGPVHSGLTGNGVITTSDLLGVSVFVSTIPPASGHLAGDPVAYFDLGFVTLGTADGFEHSRRIDHEGVLMLPPSAGAYTRIGYTIAAGAVVDITELKREP